MLGHMSTDDAYKEAVEVLQQLGLKQYEAKCFVGLSRLSTGTAKQLSEITDVPRTRVYDAIRVLEGQGLVEVQHSNPQQFRAVAIREAIDTLRDQYENRFERLQSMLEQTQKIEETEEQPVQEVWSLTGTTAIENRTEQLVADADEEVVLVLSDASDLSDVLVSTLNERVDKIDILVGSTTKGLETKIRQRVPDSFSFISGLDWLRDETEDSTDIAIGRLLLVDRSNVLVSTVRTDSEEEHAIFASGVGNGLILIFRRLFTQQEMLVSDD